MPLTKLFLDKLPSLSSVLAFCQPPTAAISESEVGGNISTEGNAGPEIIDNVVYYTSPQASGEVLCFYVGCPCVCP